MRLPSGLTASRPAEPVTESPTGSDPVAVAVPVLRISMPQYRERYPVVPAGAKPRPRPYPASDPVSASAPLRNTVSFVEDTISAEPVWFTPIADPNAWLTSCSLLNVVPFHVKTGP